MLKNHNMNMWTKIFILTLSNLKNGKLKLSIDGNHHFISGKFPGPNANLKIEDFPAYKNFYRKSLDLAIKLKDSIKIASNYWDYGSMFDQNSMLDSDSAYYYYKKSYQIYYSLLEMIKNL